MDNRMLVSREKFLNDITSANEDSFEQIKRQYMGSQVIIGSILARMTFQSEMLIEWFCQHTTEDDWISAFKTYDIYKIYTPNKKWNKKNARIVKDIYNELSFNYKNHENRS